MKLFSRLWLLLALLIALQGCTYALSANADLGAASVGSDGYDLARVGAAVGFGIVGVPSTLDVRFSREAATGGSGALSAGFQQNYTMVDLSVWYPNPTWQPFFRIGTFSNQFEGYRNATNNGSDDPQRELGIGMRHVRKLDVNGSNFLNYGYSVEAFAERGQVQLTGSSPTIQTFGIRLTAFIDTGNYVATPVVLL